MTREEFDAVARGLTGATMDVQWGDDHIYKVGGKMFAVIGSMGGLSFKVSDIAYEVLTESGHAQPAPYMARAKWVNLPQIDDWADEELADHIRSAHAIIVGKLTKKVRAELGL